MMYFYSIISLTCNKLKLPHMHLEIQILLILAVADFQTSVMTLQNTSFD